MLEKMADFFSARLAGYDEHMLQNIVGAGEFYPYTASLLPRSKGSRILDLGCGTGLELEYYFPLCPTANVTGIDLCADMLQALIKKFPDKSITTHCESYFTADFGSEYLDAAVSVESLHHFTAEEKLPLYKKLYRAIVPDGSFILTDYFAADDEEEAALRQEYLRLTQELPQNEFYHFDTPLTVQHETKTLQKAGFSVEILRNWGATYTLMAHKEQV